MEVTTVSIVVVSYNTRDITLECLRSVFRETQQDSFELIVFDNASSDGSAQAIRSEFAGRVCLLESMENLGFGCGNNEAAKHASGEYLLLLNPDTLLIDDAVGRLIEFARANPGNGVWGGRTLFADHALNPSSCWARQSLWSLLCQATGLSSLFRRSSIFNPEGIGGWDRVGVREVDIVSGCFLLIRHDLWRALDGFRECFFMYGEEADLCLRARGLGAQPVTTAAATIIHYGGASEKVRSDKMVRLIKAKKDLIRLHFPPRQHAVACWLLALWPRSRWLAHALLSLVGRRASREPRKVWGEVLRRRAEWCDSEPSA